MFVYIATWRYVKAVTGYHCGAVNDKTDVLKATANDILGLTPFSFRNVFVRARTISQMLLLKMASQQSH